MRYLLVLFLLAGCTMPYKEAHQTSLKLINGASPHGCRYVDSYICQDDNVEKYLNSHGPTVHEVIPIVEDRQLSYDEAGQFLRQMYNCVEVGGVATCDIPINRHVLTNFKGTYDYEKRDGKHYYVFYKN